MIHTFWRLSEAGADNLRLAFTDDGLLLGHTSLIERRGTHYVVRERHEIERLLKRAYHGEPPVDRLMAGFTTVASALNANDLMFGADCRGAFADSRLTKSGGSGRARRGRCTDQIRP